MNEATAAIVVLTTVADEQDARNVAAELVAERLAACVSRLPVRSTYRWREEIVEDGEVLLLIKTAAWRREALERRLAELSSYEVPEFVVLPAAEVAESYLEWLLASSRDQD